MENTLKFRPIYALVASVLTVLVFYVSLLPKQELPSVSIFQLDKLVHFSMYFVLAVLYGFGFFNWKLNSIKNQILPAIIALLVGLIVEFLQHFITETRNFDVFDIFANGIGAFFGFLLLKKLSLTV